MPKTASGRGSGFVDQGAGSVCEKARRNDLPLSGDGFRASKTPPRPESGGPSPESIVGHIEARTLVRKFVEAPTPAPPLLGHCTAQL
jgi:hypothetical protein